MQFVKPTLTIVDNSAITSASDLITVTQSPIVRDALMAESVSNNEHRKMARITGVFLRKHKFRENAKFVHEDRVPGLDRIKDVIDTVKTLCRLKNFVFEPFQEDMYRAIILSRLRHVFGDEARNFFLPVMKLLGMVSEYERKERVYDLVEEYDHKFIVVMVPRRSGKNTLAQIVSTSLLLHEPIPTSIIVWAQDMNSAVLNKENIADNLSLLKRSTCTNIEFKVTGDTITVYRADRSKAILRVKPNSPNVSIKGLVSWGNLFIHSFIMRTKQSHPKRWQPVQRRRPVKLTFNTLLRQVLRKVRPSMRITKEAVDILRQLAESKGLIRSQNKICDGYATV